MDGDGIALEFRVAGFGVGFAAVAMLPVVIVVLHANGD